MTVSVKTVRQSQALLAVASGLGAAGCVSFVLKESDPGQPTALVLALLALGLVGVCALVAHPRSASSQVRLRSVGVGLLLAWSALAGGVAYALAVVTLTGLTVGLAGCSRVLLRWVGALSALFGGLLGFVARAESSAGWLEWLGIAVFFALLWALHAESLGRRLRTDVGHDRSRLVWAGLAVLFILWMGATLAPVPLPGAPDGEADEEPEARLPRERSLGFEELNQAQGRSDSFPSDLDLEGDLERLSAELFAEVRGEDLAAEGALYLRALVLERFADDGLSGSKFELTGRVLDLSDGTQDGWITLGPRTTGRPPGLHSAGPAREAQVVQRVFRIAESDWAPLLTLPGVLAVERPELVQSESGALATLAPRVGQWSFRQTWLGAATWANGDPSAPRVEPLSAELQRSLQLPSGPGRTELDGWVQDLRAQLKLSPGESARPFDATQAVTRLFEGRGFRFVLEGPRSSGTRGLAEFLDLREGYCVHFAATAVFFLRSLGVPARVVTGFTSSEFDSNGTRCWVRGRDAHAWVEVAFGDRNWRRLDPTPAEGRSRAWGEVEREPSALENWRDHLARRWERLTAGEWDQWNGLLAQLARLPMAVLASPNGPWIGAFCLALASAIWVWRRRARRRGVESAGDHGERSEPALRRRLTSALALAGLTRGSADTWPALGRRALGQSREWGRDLVAIAADLDRERFGGVPLRLAEIERVEALIERLAAENRAAKANELATAKS